MQMIELTLKTLESISLLSGYDTVWKNADDKYSADLPEHIFQHCNEYCRSIKERADRLSLCKREDCQKVFLRAQKERAPFLRTCHAGITELVFPLFINGTYDSMIFIGPVRMEDAECPYLDMKELFVKLPEYDEARVEACRALLEALSTGFSLQDSSLSENEIDPRIAKSCDLIEECLPGHVRAPDIAQKCSLSTSRFLHLFKEVMGISFSEYVIQQRVNKAAGLLVKTRLPMPIIADECGFPNANYMGATFKKKTGKSPGKYRKEFYLDMNP